MIKIFLFFFIAGFPFICLAKITNYDDFYNVLYAKKIKVRNQEEFKQKLIENGLTEGKWYIYILRLNGMTEAELKSLAKPVIIYLPADKGPVQSISHDLTSIKSNRPECIVLSSQQLMENKKSSLYYRNYHDYIYSRLVILPEHRSFEALLINDKYSYPNMKRWVRFTRLINKENPKAGEMVYLPPCFDNMTEKISQAPVIPPVVISHPPIKQSPEKKVLRKVNKRSKNYSLTAQSALGKVFINADNDSNSRFDLTFFKLGLASVYKLEKFGIRIGFNMNHFLSIRYKSDVASGETNKLNPYFDFFLGIGRKFDDHYVSLQYDNMNYFLNKSNANIVHLTPTRVSKIGLYDTYTLTNEFKLIGGYNYFPNIGADLSGHELGIGLGKFLSKVYFLSGHYFYNSIKKDSFTNESSVFLINLSYQFQ